MSGHLLKFDAAGATVRGLFAAALRAVDPANAVRAALHIRDGTLDVGAASLNIANGVHIVAIGKAAVAMAAGALEALGDTPVAGDVITKEGHVDLPLPDSLRVHEAGHPIPDERGVRGTKKILKGLQQLDESAVVLALISGGGSALLEAPRDGVSLDDLAGATDLLMRAGAPIDALNAVRAPLSQVKAGGLRLAAPTSTWVTLVLSDVLGNDPRIIASGPTVWHASDPAKAVELIEHYGLRDRVPSSILGSLSRAPDAPGPARLDRDVVIVIGDNAAAVEAAAGEARSRGFSERIAWTAVEGEAADLGRAFVAELDTSTDESEVVLGGGEATVTVRGDGEGGRNTEFALAAAIALEQHGMHDWVVASLATDGQDGMTGLAGAIADGATCQRSRLMGVDPDLALERNDSAVVFNIAGGAVKTGPTGTNVNDLYLAVRTTAAPLDQLRKGH